MLRNLTANLITHERIETTDAKAKELRRVAERLISKAVRLGQVAYTKPPAEMPEDTGKAKELRNNLARRLHVERQIRSFIPRFGVKLDGDGAPQHIDLVEKVLIDLAQRFQGRPGGYTRIVKIGRRRGDNAPMSIIEFVGPLERAQVAAKAEKATAEVAEVPAAAENTSE
jgi:large subunit ribosomal protein L17